MESQEKQGTHDKHDKVQQARALASSAPRAVADELKSMIDRVLVARKLALGPDPSRRKAWRAIRNQREEELLTLMKRIRS